MKSSRDLVSPWWLALLTLLALASEMLAWWWVIQTPGAGSLQGPILLGLGGALCALGAFAGLWHQLSAVKLKARRARQLLVSSLDTLDVGVEIWDPQDRLVLYNRKINRLHPRFRRPADIGQTFETLMQANLRQHLFSAAVGHEKEWLAQRLATRGKHAAPLLQELAGDQWVNIHENRTPEGYLVTTRVDVTELLRKEKLLEASNRQLTQQSAMDELTGLANRRRFDEVLTTEWQRAARSTTPLSLLMVDIDHFKQYNDNYGHVAGDACLRQVATILNHCVRRAGEMVARYGGEEFVILLPGADMDHACETARKCLQLMRQEIVPHVASPTANHVTFSIGVACLLPDATLEPAIMLNAADAAMYRAKSSGRNRYEVADQADWEIDKDTPRTRPSPLA